MKVSDISACHWNILKQLFNIACHVWNDNLKQMISFIILSDWHLSGIFIISFYLPIFHFFYLLHPWYFVMHSVSFWCSTNISVKMFVTQNSLINIIEWGFFIILSLLSFGFMIWGEVVQKFLMNSTSFMQYSQKFYESPTITICFSKMTINGSTLVYGEDFYINYR